MSDNENMAACQACGVLSDRDVQWYERQASIGPKGPVMPGRFRRSTCADCATLDFTRPGAAVRAALRLLGRPETDDTLFAEVMADNDFDATVLLFPGGEPNRRPFQHAHDLRRDLKVLYAKALLLKVERATPPVPLPPPLDRGTEAPACLVCGRAEDTAWHGFVALPTPGNGVARGCLCGTCAPVFAHIGAFGTQFLANAYRGFLGLPVDLSIDRLPGLRAWYTLTAEQQAAVTGPWSWYSQPEPVAHEPLEVTVEALAAQISTLQHEIAVLRGAQG
jgi:hypothetical protein